MTMEERAEAFMHKLKIDPLFLRERGSVEMHYRELLNELLRAQREEALEEAAKECEKDTCRETCAQHRDCLYFQTKAEEIRLLKNKNAALQRKDSK